MMLHLLRGSRYAAFAALATGLMLAAPVRAADVDKADPALKWVPADVSFYSASLHMREQFQAMAKSKAWAKLTALPLVQMGWQHVQGELGKPGGPLAQLEAFRKAPENQRLLDLLADMVSEEFLVYGGGNMASFLEAIVEISGAMQFGPMTMQLSGQAQGLNPGELQAKVLFSALAKRPELIQIPELVFGFKLTKAEAAKEQLTRLSEISKALVKQYPQSKVQVSNTQVGGQDFLAISVALRDFDISLERFEKKPGEYDKLVSALKKQTLTIGLGVHDSYLLVSIGSSLAAVERLGKGGPALGTLPEFEKLAKFTDKKILDVGYISKSFSEILVKQQNPLEGVVKSAQELLKSAGGAVQLTDEMKRRIEKDLAQMSQEAKALTPTPGATLSFTFQTPRGGEGYSYDWSQNKGLDASKPLPILNHVGGTPILAAAWRSTYNPQSYDTLVKWLKVGNSYVEDLVLPQLGDAAKKQYDMAMQIALPILKKIDDATRNHVIPSMKDSQGAFVIDGKLSSKRWFEGLPAADKPLPLPEVALVLGISDETMLKKGFEEYRGAINDTLAVVSNAAGGLIPNLTMPPPETKKKSGGTLYYYAIPLFLGLDPQFQPSAGLSSSVLALSLSLEHSERLLKKTPLKTDLAVMKNLESRNTGLVFYCNTPEFMKMLSPWIGYGVKQYFASRGEDSKQADEIMKQVDVVLEVVSVIREIGAVSYQEGNVTVTHSETVFEDIK